MLKVSVLLVSKPKKKLKMLFLLVQLMQLVMKRKLKQTLQKKSIVNVKIVLVKIVNVIVVNAIVLGVVKNLVLRKKKNATAATALVKSKKTPRGVFYFKLYNNFTSLVLNSLYSPLFNPSSVKNANLLLVSFITSYPNFSNNFLTIWFLPS